MALELSKSVEKTRTAQAIVLTMRSTCVLTTRLKASMWCNMWSWVLSEADLLSMRQAEF